MNREKTKIRLLTPAEYRRYGEVDMRFTVSEELFPVNEIFPFRLEKRRVSPYRKDLGKYFSVERDAKIFDIANWAFFMAFDGEKPVGGLTLACRTEGVNMLENRSDLCVLWDLRVAEAYRRNGVGSALFSSALDWAEKHGFSEMKIESQNNNAAAYAFYLKYGAILTEIRRGVYCDEETKNELQFIWRLPLKKRRRGR